MYKPHLKAAKVPIFPSSQANSGSYLSTCASCPQKRQDLEFRGDQTAGSQQNYTPKKDTTQNIACLAIVQFFWDAEFMAKGNKHNKHCDQFPLHRSHQKELSWYRMCNRRFREPKCPLDISKKLQRDRGKSSMGIHNSVAPKNCDMHHQNSTTQRHSATEKLHSF